ncbi:hypothetical protein NDN08_000522 [Rhodosorus marinus]|uniref:Alkyl hydroperoxide reductase subunit C/ Thiol specific antioxidant domain-containing protein n=1 Tax=Rhodosorus marinus TaxID=101924 RepID=A0AAV8URT4_9RHOD|nr:hypothetical protein NDN08_000522 [Rhodosorus marinus]
MVQRALVLGKEAPYFAGPCSTGKVLRSTDYFGKVPLVLFFMPSFDAQAIRTAKLFNAEFSDFRKRRTIVLGVSPAKPEILKRFREAYHIAFEIIHDDGGVMFETFKCHGLLGRPVGHTFIISADGVLEAINKSGNYKKHVSDAKKHLPESNSYKLKTSDGFFD